MTGFGAASRLPLPPGAGDGFGGGGGGKRFGQSGQRKPCELERKLAISGTAYLDKENERRAYPDETM